MAEQKVSKKKLFLAAGAAVVAVTCAAVIAWGYASGPKPKGPSELTLHPENQEKIVAERRALELRRNLDLTEEQTAQVTEALMALRRDIRTLRAENRGDAPVMLGAGRERMQQFLDTVRGTLDDEQKQRFDSMTQDRMGRFAAMRQIMGQ
jgi:hypothetical protein